MKKIISVAVALSMLLAANGAFAQAFSDIPENNRLYESTEDLASLGILSGYEDGTVKAENNISRAEFAELAAKVLPEVVNASDAQVFMYTGGQVMIDVDADYWAAHSIERLVTLRYIDGYEDGTFRAENNITYAECVKIIIEMLNYGSFAERDGGYPRGYIAQAAELGITDGIIFEGDAPASRGDIIMMIERMLDIPHQVIAEYNMTTGKVITEPSDITYRIMHKNNYS